MCVFEKKVYTIPIDKAHDTASVPFPLTAWHRLKKRTEAVSSVLKLASFHVVPTDFVFSGNWVHAVWLMDLRLGYTWNGPKDGCSF